LDPPTILTYLENLKKSLKRNKIHVKTKNISNKDLINTKNDFRFKQLKVELVGDDTNITATIEKPSFGWRSLLSFANYLKLGGVKYSSSENETRSIGISIAVDKTAPPLLEQIKKWFEKIKKMSPTEFESLLKDLLMKVSSWLVLQDIGGSILTLLCSYGPALFQLVYVYEDKDSNGEKVTKDITKSIGIGTIFPSAEGHITYLTLLESYKKDTLFVFMNNVFSFYRQICKMPIQERQEFVRKTNEDIDKMIRDAKY
jgi:hypothetical protein